MVTGITMESTSQGGSFAVGAGNTLRGAPEQTARAPDTVKPYKAEQYAPAAQVNELPQPLNRESLNLRKYYPPQAKKNGFEGDVVLRLLDRRRRNHRQGGHRQRPGRRTRPRRGAGGP